MKMPISAAVLAIAACVASAAYAQTCTHDKSSCRAIRTCSFDSITYVGCTSASVFAQSECRQVHVLQLMPTSGPKDSIPAPPRSMNCDDVPVALNACGDAYLDSDDNGSCEDYMGGCGNDGAIQDC